MGEDVIRGSKLPKDRNESRSGKTLIKSYTTEKIFTVGLPTKRHHIVLLRY